MRSLTTSISSAGMRNCARALVARELRSSVNALALVMLIAVAAAYGNAAGSMAEALGNKAVPDTDTVKWGSVLLAALLANAFAVRVQRDRISNWFVSATTAGTITSADYILCISMVGLAYGAVFLTLGYVSFAVAWSMGARSSAIALASLLPGAVFLWASCLAFAINAAVWQRGATGQLMLAVLFILLPIVGLLAWSVRHPAPVPDYVRNALLILCPPRTFALSPWTAMYQGSYVGVMLTAAIARSATTFRQID